MCQQASASSFAQTVPSNKVFGNSHDLRNCQTPADTRFAKLLFPYCSIRRTVVTKPVLQSLVVALVLICLDYGCTTLAGLPDVQLHRLQAVQNAAARLIFSARKYDHVSPLLQELHWLRVPERIAFRLATLRIVLNITWHHATLQTSYYASLTLGPDKGCDPPQPTICTSAPPDVPPSATGPSVLLHRASGIACRQRYSRRHR